MLALINGNWQPTVGYHTRTVEYDIMNNRPACPSRDRKTFSFDATQLTTTEFLCRVKTKILQNTTNYETKLGPLVRPKMVIAQALRPWRNLFLVMQQNLTNGFSSPTARKDARDEGHYFLNQVGKEMLIPRTNEGYSHGYLQRLRQRRIGRQQNTTRLQADSK